LARRIDRGLKDELQLLTFFGTDTARPARPASLVQQLVRLVDTELPLRVLRNKALRAVDEITGRDSGAPIDMRLNRGPVDEQTEGVPDRGIAEQRIRY
jgi:hypothetical protein